MMCETPARGPKARKAAKLNQGTAMENGIADGITDGFVNCDISALRLQPDSAHHFGRDPVTKVTEKGSADAAVRALTSGELT